MRGLIIRWVISAVSLLIAAAVLPGIHLQGALLAFVAAAVLGVCNAVLRPVLLVLTLPINILTLGLFTLVINGSLLYLVAGIIRGVEIDSFWWAVLGALVIGLISWGLTALVSGTGEVEVIDLKQRKNGTWSH